ncbi:uncharacterized protein PHALS_10387 [Plasmopara halstedii]|uniref:Uncharacterized protein n=1 Tax=Plasmopara halstedii TaxID=4781 RepID=A0A0P1AG87_PLAHL|nr:uncharacterized protein PHALS_10387 [Plasmopara halstedii]CEG40175.1 hypothetical protein PHALS_10387 [Plasmopara halstedii]|eukprot:XP_024576544.1 hypothetical protein PHALS_10387 [Plasmopara halstedii]
MKFHPLPFFISQGSTNFERTRGSRPYGFLREVLAVCNQSVAATSLGLNQHFRFNFSAKIRVILCLNWCSLRYALSA